VINSTRSPFSGALKDIGQADLSTGQDVFATALGLAIVLTVYWMPIVIYMIDRKHAVPLLARMTQWIMANSRMLEIVVGLGFGVYFPRQGPRRPSLGFRTNERSVGRSPRGPLAARTDRPLAVSG
jgi:hypothetical protein